METCEDTKFWLEWGLVCDVPSCEFIWLPVWDALFCPLGDEGGVMCGVVLGDWLGFPTKVAPIKEEPTTVAMFRLWCLNNERPGTPPDNGGRSKRCLDRRGFVGTILWLSRLGFGKKIWGDWVYYHVKIMATYIKQSEKEIIFPLI